MGDSRVVLSEKGVTIALSNDHKPENKEETEKVAGGMRVKNNRIKGKLAVSRAIGDYLYKDEETKP